MLVKGEAIVVVRGRDDGKSITLLPSPSNLMKTDDLGAIGSATLVAVVIPDINTEVRRAVCALASRINFQRTKGNFAENPSVKQVSVLRIDGIAQNTRLMGKR